MLIGDKIKKIRKEKHISLSELCSLSGVQIATLSRIENMKMVGTLESHMNIAKALEIELTDLYKEMALLKQSEQPSSDSVEIFNHTQSSSIELLTKDILRKKMMPTLIHLKAKSKTKLEQFKLGSERFAYALKGPFDITVKDKRYTLEQSSSIYFDAALPHQFINSYKENISILCITTPALI